MKIITILLLFVLIINYSKCDNFVKITQYQYDYEKCTSSESSSSDSSDFIITGFSNNIERRLGSIDGGGNSGSESSNELLCDNDEVANVVYVLLDTCTSINYDYYIYSIDYGNGKIYRTEYFENDCSSNGTKSQTFPLDECLYDCTNGVFMYEIVQRDDVQIPHNTYVSIGYNGDCGDSWKNSFTNIAYYPINDCSITGPNSSINYSCNKTTIATTIYRDRLDCKATPLRTSTEYLSTGAYCGMNTTDNQFLICNI